MANLAFAVQGGAVRLHMWAFSSELYFFSKVGSTKNVPGITMLYTHMVQALDTAWEWAKSDSRNRSVLLVTDGVPTTCRGRKSTGNPTTDLHAVLEDIRRDRIVLSILGVGNYQDQYDAAFGQNNYGFVPTMAELPQALENSARVLVEAYLRSR